MATNNVLCMNCGIKEGRKRCSRCKKAFYCSQECQVKHWKEEHKKSCAQVEIGTKRKEQEERDIETLKFVSKDFITCLSCSAIEARFRCSRCKRRLYCGKKCQANHWNQHKKVCSGKAQNSFKHRNTEEGEDLSLEKRLKGLSVSGKSNVGRFQWSVIEESFLLLSNQMKKIIDIHVPNFHCEYQEVFPLEKEHFDFLEDCFNEQKSWGFDEIAMHEKIWDTEMYVEKYREFSPRLLEMLTSNPQIGDVLENLSFGTYPKERYQIWRNSPIVEKSFNFGKNYVYIGFVDLLELMMGNFSGDGDKVRFVGIEQSEICVARSLIIYEMIKMKASYDAILEVWFSTGWSDKTLELFKAACCNLLPTVQNKEVKELIQYWMMTEISLVEAKELWGAGYVSYYKMTPAGILLKKEDRIAFCRYRLTGQMFDQVKSQIHGNVTAFCRTGKFRHYELSADSFLASFKISKSFIYNGNFFESLMNFYRLKLHALVKLVAEGKVECTFHVNSVSLDNKKIIEEICLLQPHRIDWSNLADYMNKETFFRLAEACGAEKTIHLMHFMNWRRFIYGTDIYDYKNPFEVHTEQKKIFLSILKDNHKAGLIPFLRKRVSFPAPKNLSNGVLSLKYRENFLKFYFDVEDYKMDILEVIGTNLCNCFSRNNFTFNLSFQIEKQH
ncbi:uncharacterized protein LOC130635946 [Hydractinia symbiolongicarpus]|uniref:uncharacterized protein LOC130635946 n=1 Tax=Hydractinia symbiolongicarpus TaxID=13093 RepID=UPI00254B5F00|nr:uncharacterized protein LOC130635946 [Hydractinia symbiolongicarpus]